MASVFAQAGQSKLPENFANMPEEVQALILEYAFFNEQVTQRWGEYASFASNKAYVKYLDDYLSRATVDFEQGRLTVETLATSEPLKQLKSAIVTALLTPENPTGLDMFSAASIQGSGKPFLLGQVLDQQGQPIAYAWRAQQFAQSLIDQELLSATTAQGVKYWVNIELVANHNEVAAKGLHQWVSQFSDRFNLPESLILGIIETESGFNPFAVSHANAYGLMQIIPSTAGADVFEKILNKPGKPSADYLFNSRNNIEMGSGYLSILRDRYLAGVTHPTSQLYCIISAYNGGAGNVFNTFHANRAHALARINELSPADVLWRLRHKNPNLEARRYLEKVLANQQKHTN